MPVHVERLSTEVTALGDQLPWSREQVEMLVKLVLERLEQQERADSARRDETRLRPHVLPRRPDA
jgi:hypothetical protein